MAFKRFLCDKCKRRFKTARGLKVHKKMIEEVKTVELEFVAV